MHTKKIRRVIVHYYVNVCLNSTGEKIPWDDENFVIKNALESQTPENDADFNVIEKVRTHLKENVELDYCAEKGDMEKLMEEIKVSSI